MFTLVNDPIINCENAWTFHSGNGGINRTKSFWRTPIENVTSTYSPVYLVPSLVVTNTSVGLLWSMDVTTCLNLG